MKVVDGTGKELADKDIKNGTELFLDVPAAAKPGTASIKFDALAKLSLGRLFIGETYQQHPTQSLILAKAENTKLTDTIKASWGPATPTVSPSVPTKIPAGDDPQAGAPEAGHSGYTLPMIIGGVLLVGAGVGAFAFQRRRASSK